MRREHTSFYSSGLSINSGPSDSLQTCASVQQLEEHFLLASQQDSLVRTVKKMPESLFGTWDMISNVNLDGYMIALGKLQIFRFWRILAGIT